MQSVKQLIHMTSSGKCGCGRRRVKENYVTMQVKEGAGIFVSYEI